MYIVVIAWLYVAVMMAVAEATSSQGTLLGAFFTLVLYGLLPVGIAIYVMGTPLRRKKRLKNEALATGQARTSSDQPDAGSHAPGAADVASVDSAVPAVRKEP
jgi:hypothetical protein